MAGITVFAVNDIPRQRHFAIFDIGTKSAGPASSACVRTIQYTAYLDRKEWEEAIEAMEGPGGGVYRAAVVDPQEVKKRVILDIRSMDSDDSE